MRRPWILPLVLFALLGAGVFALVARAGDPAPAAPAKPSLYDRLGGTPAITAVCDEFLARFGKDERFLKNPALAKRLQAIEMPVLRMHLIAFVVKATGGPDAYTGRDMYTSHAGLNISEEEWGWSAEHLTAALDKFKVPAAERAELMGAVASLKPQIVARGTLFERLGGWNAIGAVVDEFLARFQKDARFAKNAALAKRLAAIDMGSLRWHLVFFVGKAAGGPNAYTGRDMKSSHQGLGISDEEWTWSVEHLVGALDKFSVPAKEKGELLAAVAGLKADIVEKPAGK